MEHVISTESERVIRKSEMRTLRVFASQLEDGRTCGSEKILCLALRSSIWNLYNRQLYTTRSTAEKY